MVSIAAGPYACLFLVDDHVNWSLSWDMYALGEIARRLRIRTYPSETVRGIRRQAVFHASQFVLVKPALLHGTNRVGFAYFHGRPTPQEPGFLAYYDGLRRHHEAVHRVQVTNSAMRTLVLESGIRPEKVFLIPIGIDLAYFQVQTPESKRQVRQALGLPQSAVIIGSFQKDGVGWGQGLQPKLIKGPDVLLKVMERLKPLVPELFVLLSGPARGFVTRGLERLGVPYHHTFLEDYRDIGRLFQALDCCLVTSREEGGPKAMLESMASGVPFVTTRVGQAADMVSHGRNGWMVEPGDVDGLTYWAARVLAHRDSPEVLEVLRQGRQTAEAHAYDAQLPLWRRFMQGFVESATDPDA
jgi:glycosyltransferase involved in cell wall biosynthesis